MQKKLPDVRRLDSYILKLPIANINIRFSVHATEDPEKVKEAANYLFSPDHIEDVIFKKKTLKGHYGNPISLFEAQIRDSRIIKAVVENLSSSLCQSDKERIARESILFIEKNSLYLRLDKQAAFRGELKLQRTDPIYIRIQFKIHSKKSRTDDVVEICRDIGLTL